MQNWLQSTKEIKPFLYVDENDFFREKCSNEELVNELISQGEKIFWDHREADRMKICGLLGNLYRVKGDIETALPYLERYKDYSFSNESKEEATLALLRFAEGLKYAKMYGEALASFEEVVERCEIYSIEQYKNYGWQHLGKCYLEMGDLKKAEICFLKALVLRRALNDPKLLEASEKVLNFMMNIKK